MRATFEGILSSINIRYFELNDFPTYTRVISASGWKPVPDSAMSSEQWVVIADYWLLIIDYFGTDFQPAVFTIFTIQRLSPRLLKVLASSKST